MHAAARATISLCPSFSGEEFLWRALFPAFSWAAGSAREREGRGRQCRLSRELCLIEAVATCRVSLELKRSRQQQQRTSTQLGLKEVSKDGRNV
jgi:hypothetical protein